MDNVIASTERLPSTKVRGAAAILLKEHINARSNMAGNQEVVAVKGIGQHHITRPESRTQPANEPQLTGALAAVGTDRCVQRRTRGQTNHHDDTRQRKAHARSLAARLRITRLILIGVRHRDAAAVDQLHRSASPTPPRQCPCMQLPARLARQAADHRHRQSRTRPAIATGASAARLQSTGHALRRPAVDRLLARTVCIERLANEHRQRHRRRIHPFAVLGRQRFGRFKQLRARQHVEEIYRLGRFRSTLNCLATLMLAASRITIHGDCPRGDGLDA